MNQLGTVLAQIAQQLGVAVNHIWPQIVAVTFWESMALAVIYPSIVIAATVLFWRLKNWCLKAFETGNEDMQFLGVFGIGLGAIVYFITIATVVTNYPHVLAGVFAPEGVTALDLISRFTGK